MVTDRCYRQHVDGGRFSFERATRSDFGLLSRWLAEPHVARWWNDDPSAEAVTVDFGPTADHLEPGEDFIAFHDGEPIGFIQFARLADYPDDAAELADVYPVGAGAASIDYLIGDPRRVGQGLGTAMITAFVDFVWDRHPDVTHLVVPVNSSNEASWRALRNAGFRLVARGDIEPDNSAEGWSHEVLRRDRYERLDSDMVAAALEMNPVLLPLATELLVDFAELGSDADDIIEVLVEIGIGPASRVVDLGAGKGAVAIAIARELGCDVLGIELHEPFVRSATEAAREAGVADRCRFVHGDIAKMAGSVAEADAVIYAALGDVLGPVDETIRTIRLYAKPGGHIVIADCCLRDRTTATIAGFENYVDLERTRQRLTAAGDTIVLEYLEEQDEARAEAEADDEDHDDEFPPREAALVAERAQQLAVAHPHLAAELHRFAMSQRDEYDFLDAHTQPAIWAIMRTHRPDPTTTATRSPTRH